MPFVKVYFPAGYFPTQATLVQLRRDIVTVVSTGVYCKKNWVRPLFPPDSLEIPVAGDDDGASTILVELGTGLFTKKDEEAVSDEKVIAVLEAVTDIIWARLGGKWEVEARVEVWHPTWKFIKEAVAI